MPRVKAHSARAHYLFALWWECVCEINQHERTRLMRHSFNNRPVQWHRKDYLCHRYFTLGLLDILWQTVLVNKRPVRDKIMGNCIQSQADVWINLAACKQLFLLKCPWRISVILSTICWIFWYFEPFLKIQPYAYGSNITFPQPFYLSRAYEASHHKWTQSVCGRTCSCDPIAFSFDLKRTLSKTQH